MNSPRPIRHCIFDLDGLLLDTESIYTSVTNAILARFDKRLPPEVKARMMGQKKLESARILVSTLALPMAPEDYLRERAPLLLERFPDCAPLPGAEALVRRLAASGVSLALATGSDAVEFEAKTRRHRAWIDLFATRVLGDDPAVKHGKPAPDIFLETARRLGAEAHECLVFEDAPNGAQAALAARMAVVVVPGDHAPRSSYPEVDQFLSTLEAFEPARWGLCSPGTNEPGGS